MGSIRYRIHRAHAEAAPHLELASLGFGLFVFASLGVIFLACFAFGQNGGIHKTVARTAMVISQNMRPAERSFPPALVASGRSLFLQNCAFCHGRDAGGGESGPDLTRSKLVAGDVNGSRIAPVVQNGRPGKGMPAFNMSGMQIAALVAFIHTQRIKAETQKGGRRGVDVADLQTGNAKAGKRFFDGAGKCSRCHSPTGDLAGIASKYQGLKLEERMLYPRGAPSKVTVTLPSGQVVTGTLAYDDEFTLGLRDAAGYYHSWPVSSVKYIIDSPVQAHVRLLGKYTDADIHNLMAYLQTLR
jgi:cytochrome c oxidase cbb3-type subunit 3